MDSPPPRHNVDARFALANERTLLAWARTALALLASGGAVRQLSDVRHRNLLAILLSLAGIGAAAAGGWRYQRTARALRDGQPLGAGWAPLALAAVIVGIGGVLVILVAVS